MNKFVRCACGQTCTVDESTPINRLVCPSCGRPINVPRPATGATPRAMTAAHATASGTRARGTGTEHWPILVAVLAIILLLLALVWALLAGLPEGMGGDGSGDGMGASVGAGVGEGIDGEQSGEGEDGEEGSESGGDDEPSTSAPGEPSEAPAGPPSSQAAGPSLQPDEPQPLGFAKRVETPLAASGDSSEAGARGGGSHGRSNLGADPGARGDASFTLVWSYDKNRQGTDGTGGPDIDMWVDEPGGGRLSTSRDGSALGPSPHGGRIDHDDMGAYGKGNGGGPERAFWPTGNAPKGSYKYGVRWFQGQGTVQCTVRVYRGSTLVETKKKTLTAPASGRTGPPVELGTLDVE